MNDFEDCTFFYRKQRFVFFIDTVTFLAKRKVLSNYISTVDQIKLD